MELFFQNIQNKWQSSRKSISPELDKFRALRKVITEQERISLMFNYRTISVLSIVLISIVCFFYYIAPVKELLSQMGAGIMILSLVTRIVVEAISMSKFKKINFLAPTLQSLEQSIHFHRFRSHIQKIFSPIAIGLYVLGFFLLNREFSIYLPLIYLILMDLAFVIIGIILILWLKKAVKVELETIDKATKIKKEFLKV